MRPQQLKERLWWAMTLELSEQAINEAREACAWEAWLQMIEKLGYDEDGKINI